MRKYQIIMAGMVLAVLAALGAGYQFYFKQRMDVYAQDQARKDKLEAHLNKLSKTFSGASPELVVSAWSNAVQPLADEVENRAEFFNLGKDSKLETIPEGRMPKFFYQDRLAELLNKLREEAWQKGVFIPDTSFGMPTVQDMQGQSPMDLQVVFWLSRLKLGCEITRLLLKANALMITSVELWPPYDDRQGMVSMNTAGLEFTMTLGNLCAFLDRLQRDESQYFAVNEIRVVNRQLRFYADPPLEVSMLLTLGAYKELPPGVPPPPLPGIGEALSPFDALKADKGFGRGGMMPERRKGKSWFRKYFWPFDWP